MSEKDFEKYLLDEAGAASVDDGEPGGKERPTPLFYPCKCPNCGEDDLYLYDIGIRTKSPIVGITNSGEIGVSDTDTDGGDRLMVFCGDCENVIYRDNPLSNIGFKSTDNDREHFLSEWVKSNGEGLTPLPFICPKCCSRELCREERDITFSQDVLAVCEFPSDQPVVALRYLRYLDGGLTRRYCCSQGHELAKEDGSPVENNLELVEWLKANQSVKKG